MRMKLAWLYVVVSLAAGLIATAQDRTGSAGELQLTAAFDLSYDVPTLAKTAAAAVSEGPILDGLTFLLRGSLGGVSSESADPYQLILEFQAGEWQDERSLALYRIWLLVDDPALHEALADSEGQQRTLIAHQAQIVRTASGTALMLVRVRSVLAWD